MNRTLLMTALALLIIPNTARAQDVEAKAEATTARDASLYHVPTMNARGGHDARIYAQLFQDWKTDAVFLAYRPHGATDFREVEFARASADDFVAVVPAADVQPPGFDYYIGSRSSDGEQLHYAGPTAPHQVVVLGETEQTRLAARLDRHRGNRSTFELYGEFANYGRRAVNVSGEALDTEAGSDWMWASTLEYHYRLLGALYEIAFGVGVIRGHQDTVRLDGDRRVVDPAPEIEPGREPGMNYGWGQVTWEAHRNFSTDARLLLGASATGFAAGIGGTLRIGRIAGTNLELGGEAFQDIGSLAFMRFNWDTLPRLPMALAYELTTRPNPAAPPANRLVYDLGFVVSDSLTLTGRAGYTLRGGAIQNGFMGGLSAAYSF